MGFSMFFPCFFVSGIELISAAIASNAGGHQAATLRVAEHNGWPHGRRARGPGAFGAVGGVLSLWEIPMGKNKMGR